MNAKKLAAKLNGRECREEISDEESQLAKDNNLLVVFGASDDLMELRGVIYDEVGAYNGCQIHVNDKGELIQNLDDMSHVADREGKYTAISSTWCPKVNEEVVASWIITTPAPSYPFHIFEDDELYCIGLVVDMSEVFPAPEVDTQVSEEVKQVIREHAKNLKREVGLNLSEEACLSLMNGIAMEVIEIIKQEENN